MASDANSDAVEFIYKIAPSEPKPKWPATDVADQQNAILPPSTLDTNSRFVHMSRAVQIAGTLKHFFASELGQESSVWLLKFKITRELEERGILKWESPDASICGPRDDEGLFPHLYFEGDITSASSTDASGRRLHLKKQEVEDVLELVSGLDVSGYDSVLQTDRVKQWLI